jgi:hypothetical protein
VIAFAGVYRCDVNGRTVYQETPCARQGVLIDAHPSSSFGGSSNDPVEQIRRIEAEREQRRDQADIDRRYDDARAQIDKRHCNRLASKIDWYREHERASTRVRDMNWYGASRKAYEAQYDRECR